MEFPTRDTLQQNQINNLHKLKYESLIENSYNSLTLVNVHNNDYSYQYNYLVFIDGEGNGYPLNGIIHTSPETTSSTITPYTIQPGVIFTDELYGEASTNTIDTQNEIIEELSNAITNIVNLLNNSAVSTALGIDNNANPDATEYIDNATAAAQAIHEKYDSLGNWTPTFNPPEIEPEHHYATETGELNI